jgi:hypothetical protein
VTAMCGHSMAVRYASSAAVRFSPEGVGCSFCGDCPCWFFSQLAEALRCCCSRRCRAISRLRLAAA